MTTPLPSNIQYGIVKGYFITVVGDTAGDVDNLPEAVPAVGTVTFTAAPALVTDGTAPVPSILLPKPVTVSLVDGYIQALDGSLGVALVASDSNVLNPYNWTYTVSFNFAGLKVPSFQMQVLSNQTIDLANYAPVLPSDGVGLNQATSAAAAAAASAAAAQKTVNDFIANGGGTPGTGGGNMRGPANYYGNGAPGTISGSLTNDVYTDVVGHVIYKYNGASWVVYATNQGAQGPAGPTGPAGATGAAGPTGPAGAPGTFTGSYDQLPATLLGTAIYSGPAGSGTWPLRPTSRTDITILWLNSFDTSLPPIGNGYALPSDPVDTLAQ